jgi:hypothetical protein
MPAKYALGLNTQQLNRLHDYGGPERENQLSVWTRLGLFKEPPPTPVAELPRLVDYRDETESLDARARSYLQANCAHCHMKWGGGNAEFQLVAPLPLAELGIVGTRPGQGSFELDDPRILVPGVPERSLLWHRMQRTGLGHMPHVGSNVRDDAGVELLRKWISTLR